MTPTPEVRTLLSMRLQITAVIRSLSYTQFSGLSNMGIILLGSFCTIHATTGRPLHSMSASTSGL